MLRGSALLLALVWLLSGCSVIGLVDPNFLLASKREDKVRFATESFAANLRWNRFPEAAELIAPEHRIAFLKLVQDPDRPVRFTDYSVSAVELGPGRREAQALVTFNLLRMPSLNERMLLDEQRWSYFPSKRAWLIEPDLAAYERAGLPTQALDD
jgi:hypothetical protein